MKNTDEFLGDKVSVIELNNLYIINKSSRYPVMCPYSGPTCVDAGVEPGKVYNNLEDALRDAKKLSSKNIVGFRVLTLSHEEAYWAACIDGWEKEED